MHAYDRSHRSGGGGKQSRGAAAERQRQARASLNSRRERNNKRSPPEIYSCSLRAPAPHPDLAVNGHGRVGVGLQVHGEDLEAHVVVVELVVAPG